jgi:hypothetical protein
MKPTDSTPRRRGGSFRILSLYAAAAAVAGMGIVTVATSEHGAGAQSPTLVARHGDDTVTSGTVIPVGPAAPRVVATSFAGQGWPGPNWFNSHRGQ